MHLFWILLALLGSGTHPRQNSMSCSEAGQPGVFSKYSTELCFQDIETQQRHLEIASPDGTARYVVNGDEGQFYVRGKAIGSRYLVGNDEDLIWSPDSHAVITTICFSAEGMCSSDVSYIDGRAKPLTPAVTRTIRHSFVSRHPARSHLACGSAGDIVVAGLGWLDNDRPLFTAQIASSPRCGDDWGYFDVYVLSFPQGKILHVYPMPEALKRFTRFLGPGLRRDVPKLRQKPIADLDAN
jgi:hypothetical protein